MNLFKKAKEAGTTKAAKPQKTEVEIVDPNFHKDLTRLAEVNTQMDELGAESAILAATVKERGVKEFVKLYNSRDKYPGSFNIIATGLKGLKPASFMFIPTDRYLKIDEDRFSELEEMYGARIVEQTTTYTMNNVLIEKYGEILSDLINGCKLIKKEDKEALIQATNAYSVKKGTITELDKFEGTTEEILEEIHPVYQVKNVKIND